MSNKLVPDSFKTPEVPKNPKFKLRMLTVNDIAKDYDAVITSVEHLKGVFGPKDNWPTSNLTLEQDLIELDWHQKEFQKRTSFAYTVVSLDELECLGCAYILPSENPNYDAMIIMWVRASEKNTGLDNELFKTIKKWIKEIWPFKNPGYPGREIPWDEWYKSD